LRAVAAVPAPVPAAARVVLEAPLLPATEVGKGAAVGMELPLAPVTVRRRAASRWVLAVEPR